MQAPSYHNLTLPPTYSHPDTSTIWPITPRMVNSHSNLAKMANKNTRNITSKLTRKNVQKAITKYRHLYNIAPKIINHKIFKHNDTPLLKSLLDCNNYILTNPKDIANEIYTQQSIINKSIIRICYHQPDHDPECICRVCQYFWHDLNGFTIDKHSKPNKPL